MVNYVLNRLLIAFTHTQNIAQRNIKQISPGRTSHSIPLVSLKNKIFHVSVYLHLAIRSNKRKETVSLLKSEAYNPATC